MPPSYPHRTSWTNGEIDPLLIGRTDLVGYHNGAEKMRNVIVLPQGGYRRRPGSLYIDECLQQLTEHTIASGDLTAPNGGTKADLLNETTDFVTNNLGTTDNFVVFQVDFGTSDLPDFLDIWDLRIASGGNEISEEFTLETSSDASTWGEVEHYLFSVPAAATDNGITRRFQLDDKRYARLIRKGTTDAGAFGVAISHVEAYRQNGSLSEVRVWGHQFDRDEIYIHVLTDRNIRVYRQDTEARVADIPIDVISAQVAAANHAIDLDTMVFCHIERRPQKIQRQGDDDEWDVRNWTLNNIPTFDFGSGAEAQWSTTRGWPENPMFFQGRLWFGGSKSRPSTIWASVSGDPEDFDTSTTADDKAIEATADAQGDGDEIPIIERLYAGRHLLVFTQAAEFYVPVSDDQAVTPTNLVLRRTTSRGIYPDVPVAEAEGAVMFVQRGGKAVREAVFTDTESAYEAVPISLLASHLVRTPVDMAFQSAQSTEEADYLFFVNSDLTLACFCTLRSQQINAWTLWETTGDHLAVAVVNSEVYMVVKRLVEPIDGLGFVERRYLERTSSACYMDSSVKGTGAAASATAAHLPNATVQIIVDGFQHDDKAADAAGLITFDTAATASYEIGLPFPDVSKDEDGNAAGLGYQTWVRELPPAVALPEGALQGRRYRVVDVYLRVYETTACYVEGELVTFREMGAALLDQAVPQKSRVFNIRAIPGWRNETEAEETGAFEVWQTGPGAMTILSAGYKMLRGT